MRRLTAKLLPTAVPALLAAALLAAATPAPAAAAAPAGTGFAADGPGATSYLDLGRKDCLGTARNTTSQVWYTVAGGVLSDVYYPTTDNTDVKTVQYIVTDGRTFTDLQTRDMTYTVRPLDGTWMACQVTSTAKSGVYRLVTDYITDPLRDSVVMHTSYVPLTPQARGYHIYVRYNALINGTGGGGSQNGGGGSATVDPATTGLVSYNSSTASSYAPRDYEVPVCGTLAANQRFLVASSGFAGEPSDGLTQLDSSHALTATYQNAADGNVVQTAEINTSIASARQAKVLGQPRAGRAARVTRDLAGRPRRENAAAFRAAARAHVDEVVGCRQQVEVVIDGDDRRSGVKQPVEHAHQRCHVERVQACGRLVEHVQRALLAAAQPGGDLQALRLAAR
jgi:Glucodextranase, domain N